MQDIERDDPITFDAPILVVTELPTQHQVTAAQLEYLGFRNIDSADSMTAVEKMDGQRYGVIIIDWENLRAPMTGPQLLAMIRFNSIQKQGPVLVMLTNPEADVLETIAMGGAWGHINKPLERSNLAEQVAPLLMET